MYHEYYGFSSDPFRLTPSTNPLFLHTTFKKAVSYFEYALHNGEGSLMVTGGAGSGKTTLINNIVREQHDHSIDFTVIDSTLCSGNELLGQYAANLGISSTDHGTTYTLTNAISENLDAVKKQGKRAVLILDEAHLLSEDALDKVHLLTNLNTSGQPLVQIILVGQQSLQKSILSPELQHLHQSLVATCNIKALLREETHGYIMHQLHSVGWNDSPRIAENVFPAIHRTSLGEPPWINLICSRLLLHAMAGDKNFIGIPDLCEVLNDLLCENLLPREILLSKKRKN